ncbi:MAG: hypothetical protein U1E60_16280 [Reyranellaceae bacterium]
MVKESSPYRRAVLGMPTGGVDRHLLRAAAEFARLLELELLGVFMEDPALFSLATLPFARELRLPGHDWQALDLQRMGEELRAAADRERRLFEKELMAYGVACRFEVHRGDSATLARHVARASDILIVEEPMEIDTLAAGGDPARLSLLSAATILLVPRTGMPQGGPVAAVVADPSDPCLRIASRIAAATGEKALAVPSVDQPSTAALLGSLRLALGPRRERLLVLPRQGITSDGMLLEIASQRRVPILVVGTAAHPVEGNA